MPLMFLDDNHSTELILTQMNKTRNDTDGNSMETIWKMFSTAFPNPMVIVNLAANTNVMNSKLLKMAFDKAAQECATNVTTQLSNHLSDVIFNLSGEQYGERSLRSKYNRVKNNSNEHIEFNQYVKDALSQYLGYIDHLEFIKSNGKTQNPVKNKIAVWQRIKKKKWTLLIILIVLITASIIFMMDTQKWMEWQDEHYVEVPFDSEKLTNGILKVFKEDRIQNFRKMNPNCDTEFFGKNGNATIWYGKNQKRELEYFTDLGLHPETGRNLKPITSYMIKKHICEDYK